MELYHYFEGKPICMLVTQHCVADKHLHRETEMVFLLKGELEVRVENRLFHIQEGELLSICENTLHQYGVMNSDTQIVKIKCMREWMMPSFMEQAESEAYHHLYSQSFLLRRDEVVYRIAKEMLNYSEESYVEYFYLSRLIELTAHILQHSETIKETSPVNFENARYMDEALKYLQKNCYQQLTLRMLAEHIGLTECYCSKYIKKNTGISFVQYLNAIRVNNAQRLLMYTDYNITEIAQRCGFSSIQTFNRVFKLQAGCTPRDYRTPNHRGHALACSSSCCSI
ncbi:MAG: AraC family transcriptional regulator [Eubacteriales bacterium]|nr:AraC family transcriptional regulator [Eubacteriales bacterium]